MGFPTANLDATGLALPPNGVYAGFANVKGKACYAAINIGFRPTITSGTRQLRVEAHLLDFSGELYGEELEVEIGQKLRDEAKFASQVELREQIVRDIAIVKTRV